MSITSLVLLVLAVSWDWSEATSVVGRSTEALNKEDEAYWSRLMKMSLPTPAPMQPNPTPTRPPSTTPPPTPTPLPPTPSPTAPSNPSSILPSPAPSPQPTAERILLYSNDFESPKQNVTALGNFTAWGPLYRSCPVDLGGINNFYGTEENMFMQTNTVEVFILNSTWNSSVPYADPQGRAGKYAVSFLSTAEDDLLGLGFDTSGKRFLNVAMDVSSIDVFCYIGPLGIADPIFRVSLLDDPSGTVPLTGPALDSVNMTGPVGPNQWTFLWTRNSVSLNATGSTTGRVSVVFDLLQSGYGALDNLIIQASDEPGTAQ